MRMNLSRLSNTIQALLPNKNNTTIDVCARDVRGKVLFRLFFFYLYIDINNSTMLQLIEMFLNLINTLNMIAFIFSLRGSKQFCVKLIESMPARIEAVIAARGWQTKY